MPPRKPREASAGPLATGVRSSRRLRQSEEPNLSPLQSLTTPKRASRARTTANTTAASSTAAAPATTPRALARSRRASKTTRRIQNAREPATPQEDGSEDIELDDYEASQEPEEPQLGPGNTIPSTEPSPPPSNDDLEASPSPPHSNNDDLEASPLNNDDLEASPSKNDDLEASHPANSEYDDNPVKAQEEKEASAEENEQQEKKQVSTEEHEQYEQHDANIASGLPQSIPAHSSPIQHSVTPSKTNNGESVENSASQPQQSVTPQKLSYDSGETERPDVFNFASAYKKRRAEARRARLDQHHIRQSAIEQRNTEQKLARGSSSSPSVLTKPVQSPATPAEGDLESRESNKVSDFDDEPAPGSLSAQRTAAEDRIAARCRARQTVRVLIPDTGKIVELRHFDDPISGFTSIDLIIDLDLRNALHTLAFKLTETEKVERLIRQRIEILQSEERGAALVAQMIEEKDAEIAELKEQLARQDRKKAQMKKKNLIKTNGKRRAPMDDADDSGELSSPDIRIVTLPNGARTLSDEPGADNELRRLLFHQPPPAPLYTINEDDEYDVEKAMKFPTISRVDYFLDHTTALDQHRIERSLEVMRQMKRVRRAAAGLGDEDPEDAPTMPNEEDEEAESEADVEVEVEAANHGSEDSEKNAFESADAPVSAAEVEPTPSNEPGIPSEESGIPSNEPAASTNEPAEEHVQMPQTPSRWGITSILGSVSRLVGLTPRTEPRPVFRLEREQPVSNTPTAQRRSASPVATPVTGVTSDDFVPQSAPQPREDRRNTRHYGRAKRAQEVSIRRARYYANKTRLDQEAAIKRREAIDAAEEARKAKEALDKMQQVGQKRKAPIDELPFIPAGPSGTFGMVNKYFDQNSDEEVDTVDLNDSDVALYTAAATPSPAKRVRFEDSPSSQRPAHSWGWAGHKNPPSATIPPPTISSMSHTATPRRRTVIGDPRRAQPYLGTIFKDPEERPQFAGSNVFDESRTHGDKKTHVDDIDDVTQHAIDVGNKTGFWTGPKAAKPSGANINYAGTFSVPDDSDDSELSQSGLSENLITPEKSNDEARVELSERDAVAFGDILGQDQKRRAQDAVALSEIDGNPQRALGSPLRPPPPPTPAHASLPAEQSLDAPDTDMTDDDDDNSLVARARSLAEKYKPKTPSGLREAFRVASSPIGSDGSAPHTPVNDTPAGGANPFDTRPGWNAPLSGGPSVAKMFNKAPEVSTIAWGDLVNTPLASTTAQTNVSNNSPATSSFDAWNAGRYQSESPPSNLEREQFEETATHLLDQTTENGERWVWPAATESRLPPMDEQTRAVTDAWMVSPEGAAYVADYHNVWWTNYMEEMTEREGIEAARALTTYLNNPRLPMP